MRLFGRTKQSKPEWRFCRKCRAEMRWARHDERQGFDRATGVVTSSFWDVWACPEWQYSGIDYHDYQFGEHHENEPRL